jgi:MFS family permease
MDSDSVSPDAEVAGKINLNKPAIPTPKTIPLARPPMFTALKMRNFRLFWGGAFVSNIGNWMQTIAQNWLVLALTQSPFLLGLVNFIGNLPTLIFGLYGGVIADRNSRRRVLFITQSLMLTLVMVMAILTFLDVINIWLVILITLGIGVVQAFNAPAYQTIMLDLVGKEKLMNAIALNSIQFNLSRVIGPSLAGLLVVVLGVAACFFINALSFGAVLLALFLVKMPPPQTRVKNSSAFGDIRESFGFLKNNPALLTLILTSTSFSVFIFPYLSLLAVFAKDVFKSGADAYGLLMGAVGIGAVVGGLLVARLSHLEKRSILLQIGSGVMALSLILLALVPGILWALPCLALAGGAMVLTQSSTNTIVQVNVPDQMRGRVISIWQLSSMGMLPVGSLLGGTLAQFMGAPFTVAVGAVIFGVTVLGAYLFVPSLRGL